MEDRSLSRVTIAGATLASLLHRCSSAAGDTDGLLFGQVSLLTPSSLSDDTSTDQPSTTAIAAVTAFFSSGTTASFYDSSGSLQITSLRHLLRLSPSLRLIGFFSSRRRSSLRPSLREHSVSRSLCSKSQLSFPLINDSSSSFSPSVFLLLTTPFPDQETLIQTLDYRAYQFRLSGNSFEAMPLHVVNIGPAFRGHYGCFCPNSEFPVMACDAGGSPMREDEKESNSVVNMKQCSVDQNQLNLYAEGYGVGSLRKLLGSEASGYVSGLEDLYEKMLVKLDSLARNVESSSSKVIEQENINMKLRYKVAGLE